MFPITGTDVIYENKVYHVQDTCASGFAKIGAPDINGIVWDTNWVPVEKLQPLPSKRNCPECKNWWFDRMKYGCCKGHKRTNTSITIMDDNAAGHCIDFEPIK